MTLRHLVRAFRDFPSGVAGPYTTFAGVILVGGMYLVLAILTVMTLAVIGGVR